ncbi:hypothetical protein L209DRAFT_754948 [Thermothelomyces heterothallicus CBS 203.75]
MARCGLGVFLYALVAVSMSFCGLVGHPNEKQSTRGCKINAAHRHASSHQLPVLSDLDRSSILTPA